MVSKPARVSIGMPVYNGARYLSAALDSLLKQTFSDFELIISDNASTDTTARICREYAARDRRIRYFRNDRNIGAAPNMNRVLELSAGEYFKWAAHDDLHAPGYLEKCIAVLDDKPLVVLCHSQTQHIDSNGVTISLENHLGGALTDSGGRTLYLHADESPQNVDSSHAYRRFSEVLNKRLACRDIFGLIRSDVLKSTPGLGSYFGSDRVLLAELALRGRFFHLSEYLFSWRNHADQATLLDANSRQMRHGGESCQTPRFKFLPGYCRALSTTPLSLTDRALCHLALLNNCVLRLARRWRRRAGGRGRNARTAEPFASAREHESQ